MTLLISLIGEQPIPNLLPIRHLKPSQLLLVYTSRTSQHVKRLEKLVTNDVQQLVTIQIEPYAILETREAIVEKLEEVTQQSAKLTLNITGGTKNMSLAAYMVAARFASPVIYLQTEGHQSLLHQYHFVEDELQLQNRQILPTLINNHDYIFAHVGEYQPLGHDRKTSDQRGILFEKEVVARLSPCVDEITVGIKPIADLEIDLVVRCGNQVGIVEVKTGKKTRLGIDQLNTAGGRAYFGTYTEKFLVSDFPDWAQRSNQTELAETRNIQIIELPSFAQNNQISNLEAQYLVQTICQKLGASS